MTTFQWFLLIIVVVVVPLIITVVVTLWTIDQANKRKRANRKDAQIGVKRQALLSPEEVIARKAARAETAAAESVDIAATDTRTNDPDNTESAGTVTINNLGVDESTSETITSSSGKTVAINNVGGDTPMHIEDTELAEPAEKSDPSS